MRKRPSVLLLSAAVTSGSIGAFAQAPPTTVQIDGATSTDASKSAPHASTTLSMRGTIEKYEPSGRVLSLTTANGTVRFPLTSTAHIRHGLQTIDASALEKLSRYRAVVRYSDSGGHKTVESVHVFAKSERMER
jgi:hypothetical protein